MQYAKESIIRLIIRWLAEMCQKGVMFDSVKVPIQWVYRTQFDPKDPIDGARLVGQFGGLPVRPVNCEDLSKVCWKVYADYDRITGHAGFPVRSIDDYFQHDVFLQHLPEACRSSPNEFHEYGYSGPTPLIRFADVKSMVAERDAASANPTVAAPASLGLVVATADGGPMAHVSPYEAMWLPGIPMTPIRLTNRYQF
jgi:hypothetical protein